MPEAPKHSNSVHLTTADPKRSIRFYERLGFELSECWPDERSPLRASLQLEGQAVMVGRLLPAKKFGASGASKEELRLHKKELKAFKKHRHGVGVQIYVRVSDVDRHFKETRRKKVKLLGLPKTQSYGVRDYSVVDPDGYRVVFYAPAPAEPSRSIEPRRRQPSREQPTSLPAEEFAPSSIATP